MYQKKEMRPASRPKQERRTQRTRPRPQSNYTKRPTVKRTRKKTFHMPEDRIESVPRWQLAIGVVLFVAVLFGLSYLFGWSIGHFMKGWW